MLKGGREGGRESCGGLREEYIPGGGMSMRKDPEAGMCLVC